MKYKLASAIDTKANSNHLEALADLNTHTFMHKCVHSLNDLCNHPQWEKKWKKLQVIFIAAHKCLFVFFPQKELKERSKKGIKKIWEVGVTTMEKHTEKPGMKVYVVFDWILIGVIIEAVALPAFPVPQYIFSTKFHPLYVSMLNVKYTQTHSSLDRKESHSATSQRSRHVCKPINVPPGQVDTHRQVQFLYCLSFHSLFPSIRK